MPSAWANRSTISHRSTPRNSPRHLPASARNDPRPGFFLVAIPPGVRGAGPPGSGPGGMSAWLVSLEGTEAGSLLATALAVMAAFLHAVFGALQKGRHDPWLARGAIDASYSAMAAPFALFVVPWPGAHMWPIFAGAVVRGTGPLFAVIGAWLLFGERFSPTQWLGVAVLLSGIYGLAIYNLRFYPLQRETLRMALGLAVATGLFVALYTTYDAYGIRAAADPFTFLAWFFFLDGMSILPIAGLRWRNMVARPAIGPLALRGVSGGLVAFFSFGSIMLATRLDKVGEAAVLRETSTVFAALIGWLVLKETVGPRRIALMGLIATGAVIVEFGG